MNLVLLKRKILRCLCLPSTKVNLIIISNLIIILDDGTTPIKMTPFKSPEHKIESEESEESKQLLFERRLGHLLFLVGHCALKLLIHIDGIESELKKLKIEGEKK